MNGLLVFLGFRPPPRRAPSSRRKAPAHVPRKPGVARTAAKPPQAAPRRQAPPRDELFSGAPERAVKPVRRNPVAARPPVPARRTRSIGGLGMTFLAMTMLFAGTWVGSQVQALAFGLKSRDAVAAEMSASYTLTKEQVSSYTF